MPPVGKKSSFICIYFFCVFCREYLKNNTKLSEAFVRSDLKTMTHNDKQKLKKTLYEEMLK